MTRRAEHGAVVDRVVGLPSTIEAARVGPKAQISLRGEGVPPVTILPAGQQE